MGRRLKIFWSIVIAFALLIEPITTKRGGGGFGRGGSAGRGTSAGRGGWTGGRGSSNTGRSSGGTGVGHGSGWRQTPTKSGGHGFGGYSSGPSKFKSGSGAGSFMRGSTFKNMIVGAAAGYLTYQAGKALIRNIAAPMMWNNRPYYWGQGYYRPPASGGHMCHMPVDPSDPQLGNVYYQNERPKEIVWGCGYNEVCCGYECCPGGGGGYGGGGYGGHGGGWWNGGSRIGLGSIVVLLLFCACGAFVFHQICKARRGGGDTFFGGRKYERGEGVYTERAEPPPQYVPPPGMNAYYPPPPQPRAY